VALMDAFVAESSSPLVQLGLRHLGQALPTLLDEARQQQVSYETFLYRALAVESQARRQRILLRRSQAAHLPARKTLDGFDFSFQPGLSERQVRELAGLSFVQTATSIVLLGPPGVGKTHVAGALAWLALEAGYSTFFTSLTALVEDLDAAGRKDTLRRRLRFYTRPQVLVIDEIGYTRLNPKQGQLLFELINARYTGAGCLILTSNKSFAEWGPLLGDEVLAGALLDRVLHRAEVLTINGPSYRMKDHVPQLQAPPPLTPREVMPQNA
jgi:DNA replication protein DnaC